MTDPTGHIIGGWSIELDDDRERVPLLAKLCEATEEACSVLADEGILLPQEVHLSNWLEELPDSFHNTGLPQFSLKTTPPLLANWLKDSIEEYTFGAGHPHASPEIGVDGITEVIGITGTLDIRRQICQLMVSYDGVGVIVMLLTRSTVWLPYTPAGSPQFKLANRNAPRLNRTLRRLGEVFHATVEPIEPTRYAVSTQNGIDNHRDAKGDVVPSPFSV